MNWQACFPMYNTPGVQQHLRHFWAEVEKRLVSLHMANLPATLTFEDVLQTGVPENLLLIQYCGYPYVTEWQAKGVLHPLACFDYDAIGATPYRHCSVVVVNRANEAKHIDAFRGMTVALNGHNSNSGMNLLRHLIAPLAGGESFFAKVHETGAHVTSVEAVANGTADIAAIDAVTFAYLADERPELAEKVKVLATTASSPTLPLFTPSHVPDTARTMLWEALHDVVTNPDLADLVQKKLRIKGIQPITDETLAIISDYEMQARELGYPLLG